MRKPKQPYNELMITCKWTTKGDGLIFYNFYPPPQKKRRRKNPKNKQTEEKNTHKHCCLLFWVSLFCKIWFIYCNHNLHTCVRYEIWINTGFLFVATSSQQQTYTNKNFVLPCGGKTQWLIVLQLSILWVPVKIHDLIDFICEVTKFVLFSYMFDMHCTNLNL